MCARRRTRDRINLRKKIVRLEEDIRLLERKRDAQRQEWERRKETAAERVRLLEGKSEAPSPDRSLRAVERSLDAIQRELSDLRREVQRLLRRPEEVAGRGLPHVRCVAGCSASAQRRHHRAAASWSGATVHRSTARKGAQPGRVTAARIAVPEFSDATIADVATWRGERAGVARCWLAAPGHHSYRVFVKNLKPGCSGLRLACQQWPGHWQSFLALPHATPRRLEQRHVPPRSPAARPVGPPGFPRCSKCGQRGKEGKPTERSGCGHHRRLRETWCRLRHTEGQPVWFSGVHAGKEGVLAGGLPGFRFESNPPRKCPDAAVPFGIVFHGVDVTDADLKVIAALKNLASLNLGYTKVTDAGLKEIAARSRTSPRWTSAARKCQMLA